MLSVVYFSNGKIKGYVNRGVNVAANEDEFTQRVFYRNFIKEGLKEPDNVVVDGEAFTAVVFTEAGVPIYTYHSTEGEFKHVPYGT